MRRASPYLLPHDLALAPRARFAVLLEDPQVVLVLPRAPQHVLVQPHGRPLVVVPLVPQRRGARRLPEDIGQAEKFGHSGMTEDLRLALIGLGN